MYLYQYILLAGFVCLLFKSETRYAASVFLSGWTVYLIAVYGMGFEFYFMLSATIELGIAYSLNKRYRVVSWLGYSLIVVNISGLLLHINNIRIYYDAIYAIISITQFLFLLARAIPNGINRLHRKHALVRAVNFDSRKAHDRMYKNIPKKGKNK